MPLRIVRRAAPLVAVALLTACGSRDDGTTSTPSTADHGTSSSTTADATGETTTSSPAARTAIDVVVADSQPQGGVQRIDLTLGEAVTLRVEADSDDEVHVHGYDLLADVGPGHPATIEFIADIPGQFEIELEGAGVVIVELTVA